MTAPFCQGADWEPRRTIKESGTCGACGADLVGRNHWFCPSPYREQYGESCRARYARNHFWGEARNHAIRRDRSICQGCGEVVAGNKGYGARRTQRLGVEVNHIEPRNGAGYGNGCHNHQDNLETLCHSCHVETTKQQGRERRRAASPQYAMEM